MNDVHPPKAVLIVIDMLNDFFERGTYNRDALVQAVNDLVGDARAGGVPIVCVRQEFEPDLSDAFLEMRQRRISITIKGSSGCDFLADLDVGCGRSKLGRINISMTFSCTASSGMVAVFRELHGSWFRWSFPAVCCSLPTAT